MKIGSLCTGYGGLDLAVENYFAAETVWACEFNKYASLVVQERFGVPNYGDIKTTDWTKVEPIDILTAGYPCQPFSQAGLKKGENDERHLWPYIKTIIGILRPKFVVLENVRGHFKLGFETVLNDFAEIGYDVRWTLIRASDVGAPHRRERLFIVANPNGSRCIPIGAKLSNGFEQNCEIVEHSHTDGSQLGERSKQHQGQSQSILEQLGKIIPHSHNQRGVRDLSRLSKRFNSCGEMQMQNIPHPLANNRLNPQFVEYLMGLPSGWVTDLDLPRSQQLKILGNGVVPQQAFAALQILMEQP